MASNWHTLARLYYPDSLASGESVALSKEAGGHYLAVVLRLGKEAEVRLFNDRDGEFVAIIEKNDRNDLKLKVGGLLRRPIICAQRLELVFAPLRKERQHFLIEKAVELGVTHFMPILSQRTAHRALQERRLEKYIIEATEQCERLNIAKLDPIRALPDFLTNWPKEKSLFFCKERSGAISLAQSLINTPLEEACFLVGPEGGFTSQEMLLLESYSFINPVSLGYHILRSETAALTALAFWNLYQKELL